MQLWEGLGYYSRARNLHKLAQQISSLKSIPRTQKEWLPFAGIGPYTSAAITSISFNYPAAVVDGNVVRILSRLLNIDQEFASSTEAAKFLSPKAQELLDLDEPGNYNQATMELGATICQKHNPMCTVCPVLNYCESARLGTAASLPRLKNGK